jgi:hypothetical protein
LREVYIVATEQTESLASGVLAEAFSAEDAGFKLAEDGSGFSLTSAESTVSVRFEALEAAIGWTPDLLTGSDEAHGMFRRARGFYRIAFEPGVPGPTAAVFEALGCARALLERLPGVLLDVTAFKLHELEDVAEITELDFDIRDHVNLHAVEVAEGDAPYWVHSHGMEKFGTRELEVFRLSEDDLRAAESFVHELCAELAWGEGPRVRERVETSNGEAFMLAPSEEARLTLIDLPMDTFEGHEGTSFTVVSADGRHTLADLLRPYRARFEKEPPERSAALEEQARTLLPSFKARFHRRGLMEPTTFLVRTSFEVHPEGEGEAVKEDLWVEVLTWEDAELVGKLVDGAVHTTEWRKGATVEVEEGHINAVAVGRDGRALDDEEMQGFLLAERPM